VILDTDGNIFGGFTPVEWESSEVLKSKADPSEKSFLFTLKNPHNFPARRFLLKAEKKDEVIYCDSNYCNTNTRSFTSLGDSYTNATGLEGKRVFTGSEHFQVKEIEVFEVTA
jgi:hypothetical protein